MLTAEQNIELTLQLADAKASGAKRTELSQAAADALFYKYQTQPSINLIRQFTQTGSMNDISRDLAQWWSELRGKAGLQLSGDLQVYADTVTPLLRAMAVEASKNATDALDAERAAMKIEQNALEAATDLLVKNARLEVGEARASLLIATSRVNVLEVKLEVDKKDHAQVVKDLERDLTETKTSLASSLSELDKTQKRMAHIEESAKAAALLAEQTLNQSRSHAAERLATEKGLTAEVRVKLDLEQTAHKRFESETAAAHKRLELVAKEASVRHASELTEERKRLGELSLQLGEANGRLKAAAEDRQRLVDELAQTRMDLDELQHYKSQAARIGAQVGEQMREKLSAGAKDAAASDGSNPA